jgi:hypothetical protein
LQAHSGNDSAKRAQAVDEGQSTGCRRAAKQIAGMGPENSKN